MRRHAIAPNFPSAVPARRHGVLALTLGLHLGAALLLWLGERRPRPETAPGVVSILLQPRARIAAPVQPVQPQPRVQASRRAASPAQPAPAAASTIQVPVVTSPSAPPAATEAPADPAPATGAITFDSIKRQAGRIDRELRQGKSGVPMTADTPMARFGRAVESAHVEPGLGEQIDSYTAPDGVVTYRKRVAGRSYCRRSGSVRGSFVPGASGLAGVNDAGDVPCPSGVAWQRD